MLAFVLRRVLQTIAVLGVVALIAFALFNYTGDPIAFMLGQDATLEDRARLRAELGLDQPFYVQFGHFVGNALQGDFGVSLRQGDTRDALQPQHGLYTLALRDEQGTQLQVVGSLLQLLQTGLS